GKWGEVYGVVAESPDVVIVATGGLPNSSVISDGVDLVTTSWDILAGDAKPAGETLLFDDNGAYPGLQAAELLAEAGTRLEIVTPERFFAPEIGGLNHVAYAECFHAHGLRITINTRPLPVRPEGNRLAAVLGGDYGSRTETRTVDQVVVEHGTLPLDEIYFALKPDSTNHGEGGYPAPLAHPPPEGNRHPDGRYSLVRIGDAVSSRNIHAAIYDALRLCITL